MAKKATKKAPAKKATAKATKKAPAKATAKKATAKAAPKATAKKATAKAAPKATAKKAAAPKKKSARKPNAAFMKALTPSAALAEVVGAAAAARTEIVRKIWVYIKKHNLQNPKNKRNILADEKLAKVFGKKEVSMFELASILGKHLK